MAMMPRGHVAMGLDLQVAERQAFGFAYRPDEVKDLLTGRVTLAPHPTWTLPERLTWREDPFDDRNWAFQFHMLRWLDPLRRAASKDRDDEAYAMWLRHVSDWVESNPPLKPRSWWAWTDMSDGIRALQLCLAAPLVAVRSPEKMGWLEATVRTHAQHLANPEKQGVANHALHQAEALFVCGRILHEDSLWQLALDRMSALIVEQYDRQGVNAEGATSYHDSNYLWWEKTLRRVDAEKLPRPPGAERHRTAPEEIAHATRPDGSLVMIGDTDPQAPKSVRSPFIRYVTTNGADGAPPQDRVKVYDAGYVFARSGWGTNKRRFSDETYYSISYGSSRRVHGHPDGGSLTYSADQVNWIVDPGKFHYGQSTARDHFSSRASHSVVTIEGRTPTKNAQVTLHRSTITDRHHDFVFTDGSFPGVNLVRRVIHSVRGEYLIVVDHVTSKDEVTASQRWPLGPEVQTRTSRHRVELEADGHHAALMFAGTQTDLDEVRGQDDPFDGWVSTGWKQKTPATAVSARKRGTSFRFITVVATGFGTQPTLRSFRTTEPAAFGLRVTTGHVDELIHIGRSEVTFPDSPTT